MTYEAGRARCLWPKQIKSMKHAGTITSGRVGNVAVRAQASNLSI